VLSENGISVWLDCPFDVVQRRIANTTHRPLAQDPTKFAELYEARRGAYGNAEISVKIESDDPEVTVERIMDHPLFK
jgi:shikimate kinase